MDSASTAKTQGSEQEYEQETSWTVAIKERGQAPATSHLYIEHDDHGMEHSCWSAYVTCPGSAPSQCYLAPVAGQLESPLSP